MKNHFDLMDIKLIYLVKKTSKYLFLNKEQNNNDFNH